MVTLSDPHCRSDRSRRCLSRDRGAAGHRDAADQWRLRCAVRRRGLDPFDAAEIGRLRERTFREVGEGTGQAIDLDRFDDHYQHLFVWNRYAQEIVGATAWERPTGS